MLDYYTLKWYERLQYANNNLDIDIGKLDLECISLFNVDIIHPSAIDFHCTGILKQIMKKYNNIGKSDIKNAIWHHRSKINSKKIIYGIDEYNGEYEETWKTIKSYLHISSINYISYKFNMIE